MINNKVAVVIFGNQLFKNHSAFLMYPNATVIIIEADNILSKKTYHKHKLALLLISMRKYAIFLRSKSFNVIYRDYKKKSNFSVELEKILSETKYSKLVWMKNSNKSPNIVMRKICTKLSLDWEELPNQQFVTPFDELEKYFEKNVTKNSSMDSFYRWQRKRLNILLQDKSPEGGKWSFDSENRKPLPKKITIPAIHKITNDKVSLQVFELIEKNFPNNPGDTSNFWLPTDFNQAGLWLEDFIENRLRYFGDYEDAMLEGNAFLFHSVLSPLLNIGLLEPTEVLKRVEEVYKSGNVTLNNYEGFVRQIIGWREYIYGMYEFRQTEIEQNYFGFNKKLENWWYKNPSSDLPVPLHKVLQTTFMYGYNHHIERLMVIGNWMLLSEYEPKSVFEWFMSMYVDAYEWVMVPNVYGMSQYSDGGYLATKPYISGSNYLQKMGKWWPASYDFQSDDYTKKYWQFLSNHQNKLKNNPRMSLAYLGLSKKQKN